MLKNYSFLLVLITIIALFFNANISYAQVITTPKAPSKIRPYISLNIATNPFHSLFIGGETEKSGLSVPISIGIETVNLTSKLLVRTELEVAPSTYSKTYLSSTKDQIYEEAGVTLLANLHLGTQWKYGSFYGIFGVGVAIHRKNLQGLAVIPQRNTFALNLGVGGGVNISKNWGIDLSLSYLYLGKEGPIHRDAAMISSMSYHTIRPTFGVRYTF